MLKQFTFTKHLNNFFSQSVNYFFFLSTLDKEGSKSEV